MIPVPACQNCSLGARADKGFLPDIARTISLATSEFRRRRQEIRGPQKQRRQCSVLAARRPTNPDDLPLV